MKILLIICIFVLVSHAHKATLIQTAQNTNDRLTPKEALHFSNSFNSTNIINIDFDTSFQSIFGFGGAFTEAASVNFASLNPLLQQEILDAYWGPDGIGYNMGRVHMNSCDFCLFSYNFDNITGDTELEYFDTNVTHDQHTMIPFILRANETATANGNPIWLFITPWSPPAWMKVPVNEHQSMDGSAQPNGLIESDFKTWALYFSKFIKSYKQSGIDIWGLTAQNEPEYAGTYEACLYTAEYESNFIANYLGPQMKNDFPHIKIMGYDHNRNDVYTYANTLYQNDTTKDFLSGIAFHWYGGNELYNVNKTYWLDPNDKFILATEGCNCPGVELGDWERAENYGRDIIADLNFYSKGWVDWNLVLDTFGGPNHVENYCDAMIIADTLAQAIYIQPSYYYMGQISKFIPRGSIRYNSTAYVTFTTPQGQVPLVSDNDNVIVSECNGAPNQFWNSTWGSIDVEIKMLNTPGPMCLDVQDWNTDNGANVQIYQCGNYQTNQEWSWNSSTGEITNSMQGKCLDLLDFSMETGANIQIWDCTSLWNQKWDLFEDNTIRPRGVENLCLTAGWSAFQHVVFITPKGDKVAIVMNSSDIALEFAISDDKHGYINTSIPAHSIQTYIW